MDSDSAHPQFFESTAFRRYVQRLYQLHLLFEQDADESAEAERIRDELDEFCSDFTEEEIQAVNGISADFYTLSDPEPRAGLAGESAERASKVLMEVLEMKIRREYCLAFQQIRENERFLDADRVASMRGAIWRDLGEFEIASRFLEAKGGFRH